MRRAGSVVAEEQIEAEFGEDAIPAMGLLEPRTKAQVAGFRKAARCLFALISHVLHPE